MPDFPRSFRAGSGALLALLVACREAAPEPRWIRLAQSVGTENALEVALLWEREHGGNPERTRVVRTAMGVDLTHELDPARWSPVAGRKGAWTCPLPEGAFLLANDDFAQLGPSDDFEQREAGAELEPGEFALEGDHLRAVVSTPESPPGPLQLSQRLLVGMVVDEVHGLRHESTFRPGISLWTHGRRSVSCEVPPRSQLLLWPSFQGGRGSGSAELVILLDGVELWRGAVARGAAPERVSVPLPGAGHASAEITFEAEGAPGLISLFGPMLAPAEIGTYGQRPWKNARPDVVLFLADTFRADNLAAYGGDPELTPNLNRLAEESLVFRSARSASTWTLPSVSSILTGLYPGEHDTNTTRKKLPEKLETLPEVFERAGYRTGAVTDGVFLSWEFGMEQGFRWFTRNRYTEWSLDRSVEQAREFLEADDGRPVFLFVHTFRVHTPYRVGIEEDRGAWQELVADARAASSGSGGRMEKRVEAFLAFGDRFRALYDEGVRSLDRVFGDFRALCAEQGLLDEGVLVFTADHGEAFGEHGEILHGENLYDVKLRVPLLFHGKRFAPAAVSRNVSLVHLGSTLARLAGISPGSDWHSESLLEGEADPISYAFLISPGEIVAPDGGQIAIFENRRKILSHAGPEALARGLCEQAFDLELDPNEEHNLVGVVDWPSELAQRAAGRLPELLKPRAHAGEPTLQREDLKILDELGYGGD